MEQKLKILYSDESGKLKIRGIGRCNIYVYNDGDISKSPYFWIISKDKSKITRFRLDKEYLSDKQYYSKGYKFVIIRKKDQKKIYDYIKNNLDDNGKSKWDNMIDNYCNYFNINSSDFIDNKYGVTIYENYLEIINLGKRLGKSEVMVTDQFGKHPIIRIHSFKTQFIGYISMLTGKYFGGDKLTEDEFKIIDELMRKRPNFHNEFHGYTLDDNTSNWYFILLDYILSDGYLKKDIVDKCRYYTDTDNQIPKFNTEEYYNNLELEDYLNKLIKGE